MTWKVTIRGSGRLIAAEYECPRHGMFTADLERTELGDPPAFASCPVPACLHSAEYRISAVMGKVRAIEAVKGGWTKPERETYTDTRNIGEGQSLEAWQDDRKAVWERKRQRDVVAFARANHERVRGD